MSTPLRSLHVALLFVIVVASVFSIFEGAPSNRDCRFCQAYYQRGLRAVIVPVIFGGIGGSIMALAIAKKRK